MRPSDVNRIKPKSAMKAVFEQCGLPVARAVKVTDPDSALKHARELGHSLILKRDEGAGAMGIQRVTGPLELAQRLIKLPDNYLLEQWIDAPVVSYDGLADSNGRALLVNDLDNIYCTRP